jgi:hypothetical protein
MNAINFEFNELEFIENPIRNIEFAKKDKLSPRI